MKSTCPAGSSSSASRSPPIPIMSIVAQFTKINYKWDADHVALKYIANGDYVEKNNVITGIKILQQKNNGGSKRVFLTVPRWLPGVPSTLNYVDLNLDEITSGNAVEDLPLNPWPSWEWNKVGDCSKLQYVQSMEIDANGLMWIIDVGRRNILLPTSVNQCPPKLIVLDSKTGLPPSGEQAYVFPSEVASYTKSFLNDIVIDTKGNVAYISDAGTGAIVVYDRTLRKSRRFTDPTMDADPTIDWTIDGKNYGTNAFPTPTDTIGLTPDMSRVYYAPLEGNHFYSVEASKLRDFNIVDDTDYAAAVRASLVKLGRKGSTSDGMTISCDGTLFYGGLTTASVYAWKPNKDVSNIPPQKYETVLLKNQQKNIWVDTFAWGHDKSLYWTANHLDLLLKSNPHNHGPVYIWRQPPGENGVVGSYVYGSCLPSEGGQDEKGENYIPAIVILGVLACLAIVTAIFAKFCRKKKNEENKAALHEKLNNA